MNPKCMLVSALLSGSVSVTTAMETADEVEMKIAKSRCYCSDKDMIYVCTNEDPGFMETLKTYNEHGYPCEVMSNKQYIYNHVLQDARDEYTLHALPFHPREFWKKPIEEQLIKLKEAILELKLPNTAPNFHQNIGYTDNKTFIGCGKASYPEKLEEKFEEAVWKILSKDYKITLEDFTASLRSALESKDRLYTAPLLMHFTNYLVPRFEFYYKTKGYKRESEPYKTLKYPSIFEIANGAKNVGVVVYERKE